MSQRVVVTGIGLVTPLGLTRETTWAALCAGRSGIGPLPLPLRGLFACHHAGWLAWPAGEETQAPDKTHAVALRGAAEALADAAVGDDEEIAIVIGNSAAEYDLDRKRALLLGDASRRGTQGAAVRLDEFALAAWLRDRLRLSGPVAMLASNCVAGLHAIVLGARRIAAGRNTRVLAGGVDCAVTPEMLARFSLLRAVTPSVDAACVRPFDEARDGMALADGAGFLLLEAESAARRRGAAVYGEVAGFGLTADAYHPTRGAPDGRAKAAAMRAALAMAGLAAEHVDLVSAHGTATVDNDENEIRALRLALGTHAERVAVTAPKSALGHSLAASGAVESALALLTMRDGIAPPILNLTRPAAACAVGGLLRTARALRPRAVLKNAFAFGGLNASLVLRPPLPQRGPRRRSTIPRYPCRTAAPVPSVP